MAFLGQIVLECPFMFLLPSGIYLFWQCSLFYQTMVSLSQVEDTRGMYACPRLSEVYHH